MKSVYSLVYMSAPGTICHPRDNRSIQNLIGILDKCNIHYSFVDTVPGWGNLNQDWVQFECNLHTSWDWCEIAEFSVEDKKWLLSELTNGRLLMMCDYVIDGEHIPHH